LIKIRGVDRLSPHARLTPKDQSRIRGGRESLGGFIGVHSIPSDVQMADRRTE
jgi:hypothetical protein